MDKVTEQQNERKPFDILSLARNILSVPAIDSPLVAPKRVGIETCDAHGDCVVVFQGRACPYCLTLDEDEQLRNDNRDMQHTIASMEMEARR